MAAEPSRQWTGNEEEEEEKVAIASAVVASSSSKPIPSSEHTESAPVYVEKPLDIDRLQVNTLFVIVPENPFSFRKEDRISQFDEKRFISVIAAVAKERGHIPPNIVYLGPDPGIRTYAGLLREIITSGKKFGVNGFAPSEVTDYNLRMSRNEGVPRHSLDQITARLVRDEGLPSESMEQLNRRARTVFQHYGQNMEIGIGPATSESLGPHASPYVIVLITSALFYAMHTQYESVLAVTYADHTKDALFASPSYDAGDRTCEISSNGGSKHERDGRRENGNSNSRHHRRQVIKEKRAEGDEKSSPTTEQVSKSNLPENGAVAEKTREEIVTPTINETQERKEKPKPHHHGNGKSSTKSRIHASSHHRRENGEVNRSKRRSVAERRPITSSSNHRSHASASSSRRRHHRSPSVSSTSSSSRASSDDEVELERVLNILPHYSTLPTIPIPLREPAVDEVRHGDRRDLLSSPVKQSRHREGHSRRK